MTVCRCGDVI